MKWFRPPHDFTEPLTVTQSEYAIIRYKIRRDVVHSSHITRFSARSICTVSSSQEQLLNSGLNSKKVTSFKLGRQRLYIESSSILFI